MKKRRNSTVYKCRKYVASRCGNSIVDYRNVFASVLYKYVYSQVTLASSLMANCLASRTLLSTSALSPMFRSERKRNTKNKH
jgi:hypothetical protein